MINLYFLQKRRALILILLTYSGAIAAMNSPIKPDEIVTFIMFLPALGNFILL
jgi:hypothetical protein